MLKERHQLFIGLFVAADLAVLAAAWALAYAVRFVVPVIPVTKGTPPPSDYLLLLPVIWAIWASSSAPPASTIRCAGAPARRSSDGSSALPRWRC
jgi:hypothetical protein